MGNRWRVMERKKEKEEDGEGEGKWGVEVREKEEEEVLSGHCGPMGDREVPEINWLPDKILPSVRWVRSPRDIGAI